MSESSSRVKSVAWPLIESTVFKGCPHLDLGKHLGGNVKDCQLPSTVAKDETLPLELCCIKGNFWKVGSMVFRLLSVRFRGAPCATRIPRNTDGGNRKRGSDSFNLSGVCIGIRNEL